MGTGKLHRGRFSHPMLNERQQERYKIAEELGSSSYHPMATTILYDKHTRKDQTLARPS